MSDFLSIEWTGISFKDVFTTSRWAVNLIGHQLIFTVEITDFGVSSLTLSGFFFFVQEKAGEKKNISVGFIDFANCVFLQALLRPPGSSVIWIMGLLKKQVQIIPSVADRIPRFFNGGVFFCDDRRFGRK